MPPNLEWFMRALHGARPARDVLVALAIKLGLLACIYVLFFDSVHRPPSDAAATGGALVGTAAARNSR